MPPSSSSASATTTFADVRSAHIALESSLRRLPNSHRMHCEGNLLMVSPAFGSESDYVAFADRPGVGYLSSRLCNLMQHLHAALGDSSQGQLWSRSASQSQSQSQSQSHTQSGSLSLSLSVQSLPSPYSPLRSPLSPLSPDIVGPALSSATMLNMLVDKLVWFGKTPPESRHTQEISLLWINASSLVYRLTRLPTHTQLSCGNTMDEIRECIDDPDLETIALSVAVPDSGSSSPLMDQWAKDIEEVVDLAMRSSPTSELQQVKTSVSVIRRLLGAPRH